VAIEDRRFYEHRGVDYEGIGRAAWKDISAGEIREGASTLTMQLISQRYITKERTFDRKIKEAWLAIQLEKETPKQKILEQYLNTIFYGRNAYGVEAAARVYFSRTAQKLTLPQAALIAGLAQLPSAYDPLTYPERARQRRNEVSTRCARPARSPTPSGGGRAPRACSSSRTREPTAATASRSSSPTSRASSTRTEVRRRQGREGGLWVRTTIDLSLQRQAERAMRTVLHNAGDPAAAVVTIDPKTGDILALASTQRFDKAQYNLATQGKRQPGSTFKPMTLAAAIEMGINPQSTRYVSRRFVCDYPEDAEQGCPFGGWDVNTADESPTGGPVTLYDATLASDNTVYAQLAIDVGADKIKNMAERMGITSKLDPVVSLTLGAEDVTPLELTSAYATLAANGVYRSRGS
jgi:penicillin-binding protein 1A